MTNGIPLLTESRYCKPGSSAIYWHDEIVSDDYDERRLEKMPKRSVEVAGVIFQRARKHCVCRLSAEGIVKKLGMSYSTVNKIFKALEDEGWLVRTRYANRHAGIASEYRLSVPERVAKTFRDLELLDVDDVEDGLAEDELEHEEEALDVEEVELDAHEEPVEAEEVPARTFPTPEELRAMEEREKAEKELLARKYEKNELGEWQTKTEEPEPTEVDLDDFRSRFGIRLKAEPEEPRREELGRRHLRLVS